MSGFWSYFGYSDNSPYSINGKVDETEDTYNYIISMEYDNFRYKQIVSVDKFDESDLEMSRLFIKVFIKKLKLLINNDIESMTLDGESNMNTTYCKIYHKEGEYFITQVDKSIDDWIIKFDDNFGQKLLVVLESLLIGLGDKNL